jgi:hypothetical protein
MTSVLARYQSLEDGKICGEMVKFHGDSHENPIQLGKCVVKLSNTVGKFVVKKIVGFWFQ